MDGWIKLHRKFLEWEWFNDSNMVHLFLYLLISANHKLKKWHGIPVERGQLITGLNSISEDTGISVQSIRTSIKRLISTNEITRKTTNKYSLITICKYDSYQVENKVANKQVNKQPNKQLTINQQSTNNNQERKEGKEVKEDKNKIPPDLKNVRIFIIEKGYKIDAENFIDFYQAKGWMIGKNKMKDWQAAIRTWVNKNQATIEEKRPPTLEEMMPWN